MKYEYAVIPIENLVEPQELLSSPDAKKEVVCTSLAASLNAKDAEGYELITILKSIVGGYAVFKRLLSQGSNG